MFEIAGESKLFYKMVAQKQMYTVILNQRRNIFELSSTLCQGNCYCQ